MAFSEADPINVLSQIASPEVVVLLPRLVAILSSGLEILPTLLIQSKKLFHFTFTAIDSLKHFI